MIGLRVCEAKPILEEEAGASFSRGAGRQLRLPPSGSVVASSVTDGMFPITASLPPSFDFDEAHVLISGLRAVALGEICVAKPCG